MASKEDQLAKERAAKNEAVAELCLLKAQLAQATFFLFSFFFFFQATSDASAELYLLKAQLALAHLSLKCWLLLDVVLVSRSICTFVLVKQVFRFFSFARAPQAQVNL